jgi:apoptosis-inducing factor 3
VAAQNMLGGKVRFSTVPFFWTAQFGRSIRYVGYCHKPDSVIVHGSLDSPAGSAAFTHYYVVRGRVAAVATFSRDPQAAAALELMRLGEMPSPSVLEGVDSFDLQNYLRGQLAASAAGTKGAGGAASGGR